MLERRPADTAPIIVIDLQTSMFDGAVEPPIHDSAGLVARVQAVMEWARRTRRKIAFVRHDGAEGDSLAPGSPGWPVWPALGQAEDEPTFAKSVGDAFSNAALPEWVSNQGADEVVLLGAQTDRCVAATVTGAIEAGFRVTVVSDAHSTWDLGGETAEEIIARYNAAFTTAGVNLVTTQSLTGSDHRSPRSYL
jgi:nicotinamidase-related amidase